MPFLRRRSDDDLFSESTMTFGQHLEELRRCLFKAIYGLIIGTILGMLVGTYVVDFIQSPLQKALKRYYEQQSYNSINAELEKLKTAGVDVPEDSEALKKFLVDKSLVFEKVFVNPKELAGLGGAEKGGSRAVLAEAKQVQSAAQDPLVPIFLARQLDNDPRVQLKSFNAQEPFMIWVKASLLVGVIIASPWIFYQIWLFVGAGLYRHERHYVHVFLPFSLALFFAGASMAFFFVFEPVLNFLFSFNASLHISPEPRINEWLSFVLFMPLGFGVSFQLPLVMLFLERIGIFDVKAYLSYWRVSVLVIFVLSMVLTPSGDPYSMLLMALPLVVLYFGGVLLCKFMPRARSRAKDFVGNA